MGWSQKQRAWMRQLMGVSCVTDEDYKSKLKEITGCESSTSEGLTNAHFEGVMCWLEMEVCRAISDNLISVGDVLTKISDPWSFHRRKIRGDSVPYSHGAPKTKTQEDKDAPTRAQLGLIDATRKDLSPYDPQISTWTYIQAMIHNGCFGPAPECPEKLTRAQASKLINALKEKLARHVSSGEMMSRPQRIQGILDSATLDTVPETSNDPLPF